MALNPKRRHKPVVMNSRQSMTAAAEQLRERLDKASGGGSIGEPWQRDAWDFYDLVPELRTIAQITGRAMSQCRLVLARVNGNGEPVPLDLSVDKDGKPINPEDFNHKAVPLLAAFAGGQGGQSELLDTIGINLTVSGETICVGSADPAVGRLDDFFRFQAYSEQQVEVRNKQIIVRLDESQQANRTVDEDAEEAPMAVRIWRPHPKYNWMADAMARSSQGVLSEIVGYDQHIEAARMSRLMGAGIQGVPEGMTLPELAQDDGVQIHPDPFIALLMDIAGTAIGDRRSAAAMIPIFLRGEIEDLKAMKETYMTFSTPFDDKVSDLRDKAIRRLAVAADMPPEIPLGIGDTQHWTGALVTEDWKKSYLPTLMGLTCGSLTTGWLYPAMLRVIGADALADVIVWYDDSSVRTRENVGPEARNAFLDGAIGLKSYRRVLGFDDGDAPTTADLILVMLLKSPALAPLLLPKLGIAFTPEELASAEQIGGALAKTTIREDAGGNPIATTPTEPGAQSEPIPALTPGSMGTTARNGSKPSRALI